MQNKERKYAYPAVFKKFEDGRYTASFVDFENFYYAEADNLVDILERAEGLLCMMTHLHEMTGLDFPEPTPLEEVDTEEDEFASYVLADISSL